VDDDLTSMMAKLDHKLGASRGAKKQQSKRNVLDGANSSNNTPFMNFRSGIKLGEKTIESKKVRKELEMTK